MMKKVSNYNNVHGKMSDSSTTTSSSSSSRDEEVVWEMRPGGMLVQKRDENVPVVPQLNMRLRIAFGALRYEILVNSQATFGEVKKVVKVETGLEANEQRLVYRGKERENGEYLDRCGVKDGSKVVVIQDPASIERRYLEMRKNARIQRANRAIADVSMEIDKLAHQVSAIEKSISSGNKVAEVQITTVIEMLMRQAVKLESIAAEGDASSHKILQGKRVQKNVEALDVLKLRNGRIKAVIVTTKWEAFDHPPPLSSAHWEIFE